MRSVSQRRICIEKVTYCRPEKESADQTSISSIRAEFRVDNLLPVSSFVHRQLQIDFKPSTTKGAAYILTNSLEYRLSHPFFLNCLAGCFSMIVWTPAVLSVFYACVLYS